MVGRFARLAGTTDDRIAPDEHLADLDAADGLHRGIDADLEAGERLAQVGHADARAGVRVAAVDGRRPPSVSRRAVIARVDSAIP